MATYTSYILPSITPHLMWLVDLCYSVNMTRTDVSYNVFVDNMELPIHSGSEVSVPVQDSTTFIRAVRELVRKGDFMLNWYQEVRVHPPTPHPHRKVANYSIIYVSVVGMQVWALSLLGTPNDV